MKIVLASQSLFRKKALDLLGLEYETVSSNLDESSIRDTNPKKLVVALSRAKAEKVAQKYPDALVIAADLVVTYNKHTLEKPASKEDAVKMLRLLSGKTFEIVSGTTVLHSKTKKTSSNVDSCKISFRDLSDNEILDYVNRYSVTTFAGGFDADGIMRFANHLEGAYNFSTGFSTARLVELLREYGINE